MTENSHRNGATIRSGGLTLAKSGPIEMRFDPNAIELLPMSLDNRKFHRTSECSSHRPAHRELRPEQSHFDAKLFSSAAPVAKIVLQNHRQSTIVKKLIRAAWNYELALRGDFTHFEDFLNAARLIGRPLNAGWQVEGGLTANLQWQGILHQRFPKPTGDVSPRAMTLKLPLLNQSVEIENAKIELKPNEPRVTIAKATALGAHWQGTIWRNNLPSPPNNAPRLTGNSISLPITLTPRSSIAGSVRAPVRIGSRAYLLRPEMRRRKFPAPVRYHSFTRTALCAQTLSPSRRLEVQSLRAQIEMLGRNVNFSEFEAKLNGGTISGGLLAELGRRSHLLAARRR